MYEEIDLRQYVRTLIDNIWWIIGSTILCAAIGLIVSSMLPRTYEATALIAVTKPRYVMQFDSRLQTAQQLPAYKVYPDLALSGDVLQTTMERLSPSGLAFNSLADLRGSLDASSAADPSLIRLTVRSRSPEHARTIANVWAQVFVERADAIYGQSGEQADFFAAQLSRAEGDLEIVEAALIEFQARNDVAILRNRLDSVIQTQSDYLTSQRNATYLVQDVRNLQAQLAGQPRAYQVSPADQVTALFLQIKAFNAQTESPIQIQLGSAERLSDLSTAEQIAFLDDLADVLEQHSEALTEHLREIEPRILNLQQQLQIVTIEEDRLHRVRDLAKETVFALSRKTQETRIAAEDIDGEVVVASRATVPDKPSNPSKMIVTAVAGMLGGSLAVVGVLGLAWWQDEAELSTSERTRASSSEKL